MAALQSFRGDYFFRGTEGQKQRQVGNAVPPKLALALADQVRDALDRDGLAGQTTLADYVVAND